MYAWMQDWIKITIPGGSWGPNSGTLSQKSRLWLTGWTFFTCKLEFKVDICNWSSVLCVSYFHKSEVWFLGWSLNILSDKSNLWWREPGRCDTDLQSANIHSSIVECSALRLLMEENVPGYASWSSSFFFQKTELSRERETWCDTCFTLMLFS